MDFKEYIPEDKFDSFQEDLESYTQSKISEYEQEKLPVIEKEKEDFYKGKASQGADSILDNISGAFAEKYGFETRQKGQKFEEYFIPQVESYIEKLAKEKGVVDSEFKAKYDEAQKKLAEFQDYGEIKEKASLYEQEKEKAKALFEENSISKELPKFDSSKNPYEINAKVANFKDKILSEYNIVEENGVRMCVSKQNEHLKKKLSDLVSKDTEIQSLIEVTPQGLGTGGKSTLSIVEVPFEVPDSKDPKDISKAINSYLNTKSLNTWERSEEFTKYYGKIMKHIKSLRD